jgi:hypothetical protein
MNTRLLKKVRKAWNNPDVPMELNRTNMRKWVKSVRMLGSNWLLAVPVEKKT